MLFRAAFLFLTLIASSAADYGMTRADEFEMLKLVNDLRRSVGVGYLCLSK